MHTCDTTPCGYVYTAVTLEVHALLETTAVNSLTKRNGPWACGYVVCIPVVRSETGFVIPAPERWISLERSFAVSEYLKFSSHIFISQIHSGFEFMELGWHTECLPRCSCFDCSPDVTPVVLVLNLVSKVYYSCRLYYPSMYYRGFKCKPGGTLGYNIIVAPNLH